MRVASLFCTLTTGCTAVFGLEAPTHSAPDDAAMQSDDSGLTDAPPADAMVDAPPVDVASMCPSGFTTITVGGSTSQYLLVTNNNVAWDAAEADCESRGPTTHLFVVDDEQARMAADLATTGATWIGLSDRITELDFQWVTDQATPNYPGTTSPPWNVPPTADTLRNCVQILSSGLFSDVSCTVNRPYICECDAYAANPAHY